jgi:hypothetical protein
VNELNIKGLIIDCAPLDVYTDAYLKPSPKGAIPPQASRVADPSYCHKKEDRKNPLVSPAFATREQVKAFPPTLIITASRDSLCAEGEKFKDLLIDSGVNVTFKRFEAKHGFAHNGGPDADEAWIIMINHLKECLWDCYTNEKVLVKCKKSSGNLLMNIAAAISITLAIIANILFFDLNNAAEASILLTLVKINIIFLPVLIIFTTIINGLKKSELSVSDRRVYGCAVFGKRIDLPFSSISAVGKSALKGIRITTSSGVIKFKLFSNASELYSAIGKMIAKK